MTLNIDLEEVPFAILEAVKARILANRRRLQQEQQQPRPSLRPRPQFVKIGANSKTWRLPKTAVRVLDGGYAYATAYLVEYQGEGGGVGLRDTRYRLFSCDGTAFVDVGLPISPYPPLPATTGYADLDAFELASAWNVASSGYLAVCFPPNNSPSTRRTVDGSDWIFFPAGGDRMIALLQYGAVWSDFGFRVSAAPSYLPITLQDLGSGSTLIQRAFLVSRSAVREIAVPSSLSSLISSYEPFFFEENIYASLGYPNGLPPLPQLLGTIKIPAGYGGLGVNGFFSNCRFGDITAGSAFDGDGRAQFYGYGPGAFRYLSDPDAADAAILAQPGYDGTPETLWKKETAVEEFIGQELLPEGSLAVSIVNPRNALLYRGSYPPISNFFPPINGAENPIWEVQDEPVIDGLLTSVTVPSFTGNAPVTPDPIFYWDWGKPDYCRQQLLALGFTSADLEP